MLVTGIPGASEVRASLGLVLFRTHTTIICYTILYHFWACETEYNLWRPSCRYSRVLSALVLYLLGVKIERHNWDRGSIAVL